MKELRIIGKNIVKRRNKLKMTQDDLSGLAEIDRSYLSEIENGKMNLTIKALVSIAKALDCKLSDLILDKK